MATPSTLYATNSSTIGSTGIRIRQLCDTTVVTCTNVDVINGKSRRQLGKTAVGTGV